MEPADYRALVDRCQVIERDSFGEKVLQTPEGLIIKIFRRKRLLTSATVYPYARRFVHNVARLAARRVPTVEILDFTRCPGMQRHLVTYRPLPGMTVRSALKDRASDPDRLLASVSRFVSDLHRKGICFRSLHFGNIIVSPEKVLGLIDVADMTMRPWPLGVRSRERNFGHMLRYREDVEALRTFGWINFVESYLENACLSPKRRGTLLTSLSNLPELALPAAGGPLK